MSAFLGHIHYWLYRKIQLLVERENLILEKTTKVVDDLAFLPVCWNIRSTPARVSSRG